MANLLIVEDDENLRLVLEDNLVEEGYAVKVAGDCESAITALTSQEIDLIILDIMLPDGNGYDLCTRLRSDGYQGRVLMLTARTLEDDIVKGFESGADDYLVKPYRLRELLARVKTLLQREPLHSERDNQTIMFAGFVVDTNARIIKDAAKHPVELTQKEFDILVELLRNQGRVLSRNDILDTVWGKRVVVDQRTVDNFVSSIKKKLSWTADSSFCIHSVRGVGYRMEVNDTNVSQKTLPNVDPNEQTTPN